MRDATGGIQTTAVGWVRPPRPGMSRAFSAVSQLAPRSDSWNSSAISQRLTSAAATIHEMFIFTFEIYQRRRGPFGAAVRGSSEHLAGVEDALRVERRADAALQLELLVAEFVGAASAA